MQVVIAADHRGFQLKEEIKMRSFNIDGGIEWVDVGPLQDNPKDDYPDFAKALVEKMQSSPDLKKGVLVCGSGVGMSIAANKFSGIRCGLALNPAQVKAARSEDNINILAIAADYAQADAAVVMIEVFLKTEFGKMPRHTRRIEKIMEIENRELKVEN